MLTTYSTRNKDILCEEDTLGLNDEEVDELMDVTDKRVECLLRDCVVFPWADLCNEAVGEQGFSEPFSSHSNTQSHPCNFKGISEDIEVPGGEDEGDDGEEGNARSSGIIP